MNANGLETSQELQGIEWETLENRRYRTRKVVQVRCTRGSNEKGLITLTQGACSMILGTQQQLHLVIGVKDKKLCFKICNAETVESRVLQKGPTCFTASWIVDRILGTEMKEKRTKVAVLKQVHRDMYVADFEEVQTE